MKHQGCSSETPGLVAAVANQYFKTNLTVIIFDDLYFMDLNFMVSLEGVNTYNLLVSH